MHKRRTALCCVNLLHAVANKVAHRLHEHSATSQSRGRRIPKAPWGHRRLARAETNLRCWTPYSTAYKRSTMILVFRLRSHSQHFVFKVRIRPIIPCIEPLSHASLSYFHFTVTTHTFKNLRNCVPSRSCPRTPRTLVPQFPKPETDRRSSLFPSIPVSAEACCSFPFISQLTLCSLRQIGSNGYKLTP